MLSTAAREALKIPDYLSSNSLWNGGAGGVDRFNHSHQTISRCRWQCGHGTCIVPSIRLYQHHSRRLWCDAMCDERCREVKLKRQQWRRISLHRARAYSVNTRHTLKGKPFGIQLDERLDFDLLLFFVIFIKKSVSRSPSCCVLSPSWRSLLCHWTSPRKSTGSQTLNIWVCFSGIPAKHFPSRRDPTLIIKWMINTYKHMQSRQTSTRVS